jgi:hypothetical protein
VVVTLERDVYTNDGIFGWLRVGDLELATVELPWKDNVPFKSAIPVGTYPLKLGMYNRGGYPAYEILDVPGRGLIKIHVANTMDQLLGCIGPGLKRGYLAPKPDMPARGGVVSSRAALERFMEEMNGAKTGTITIFNSDSLSL